GRGPGSLPAAASELAADRRFRQRLRLVVPRDGQRLPRYAAQTEEHRFAGRFAIERRELDGSGIGKGAAAPDGGGSAERSAGEGTGGADVARPGGALDQRS